MKLFANKTAFPVSDGLASRISAGIKNAAGLPAAH
jgi:hypothetical protein